MPGSPEDVFTARLIGGDMDGAVVEVNSGAETLEFGPPLVVFGSPRAGAEHLSRRTYRYRYSGVEATPDGPRSVFAYVVA